MMQPVPVPEEDGDGGENIWEIRLSILSLEAALSATTQEFKTQDPLDNISTARILWQVASWEIPRIYGIKGALAIHVMEMMAYIGDDKYVYRPKRALGDLKEILGIAHAWGLLTLSDDFKFSGGDSFTRLGTMYFHSRALMEAIVKETKDRECQMLHATMSSGFKFSFENLHSILIFCLEHEDVQLLSQFDISEINEGWLRASRDQAVFDKIIARHEAVFGKFHARTLTLKSLDVKRMLTNPETSLEEKWTKWNQNDGFKSSLDEFFKFKSHETAQEEEEDRITEPYEESMIEVFEILSNLIKNPRPRTELEEKFLNAGIEMGMNLLRYKIIRWQWAASMLSKMLSCCEDLGRVEDVPDILIRWDYAIIKNSSGVLMYNGYNYYEDSPEMEGIATSIRMAAAKGTDRELRQDIMGQLFSIVKFYDEDLRYSCSRFGLIPQMVPDVAATLSRLYLFRVQCLNGKKKVFNHIVSI